MQETELLAQYQRQIDAEKAKIARQLNKPTYDNLQKLYSICYYALDDFGEDVEKRTYLCKVLNYVHTACLRMYATGCGDKYDTLYWDCILLEAKKYQVDSALLYLEKDRQPKDRFYLPRREVFMKFGIVQALQDLIDDKLDILSVSLPPGTGKSTIEIFFLSLVGGWWPNDFNLSSAHSSILTRSLYDGICEIYDDEYEYKWHEIFPTVKLQSKNAKETTINLERANRFKTWTMRSIDGTLTGATRCNRFETSDDLVSGIEEALNKTRMDTLWNKVTNDLRSRMLDGCKQLFFATRWSVHDPIGRMQELNKGNPRARFIAVPALDENGESNFRYQYNGFSKEYFLAQKEAMDEISFNSLYQQQPIEREGLLFPADALKRFIREGDILPDGEGADVIVMPAREPDAIWCICDTKDKGADFESMPIAYQYDQLFFIVDLVFDDTTDYGALDQKTAKKLIEHNPHKTRFESNNAGSRVAYNVQQIIDDYRKTGAISRVYIDTRYTTTNKETKILVNSNWVIKNCLFLHPSQYSVKEDYGKFMACLTKYTTKGKVDHDDAPDSLAMLAEYVQGVYSLHPTEVVESPF